MSRGRIDPGATVDLDAEFVSRLGTRISPGNLGGSSRHHHFHNRNADRGIEGVCGACGSKDHRGRGVSLRAEQYAECRSDKQHSDHHPKHDPRLASTLGGPLLGPCLWRRPRRCRHPAHGTIHLCVRRHPHPRAGPDRPRTGTVRRHSLSATYHVSVVCAIILLRRGLEDRLLGDNPLRTL